SERDGQDRLDQNLRCRARITSHCFRSFHADQTDSEGGAERGQANVKACGHVILLSLPVMPPNNRYRCVPATSCCLCCQTSRLKTAHNSMKTRTFTRPTSN